MMSSYVDLFGIVFTEDGNVDVGDCVTTGTNSEPRYEVIALHHDKAWVRSINYGQDYVVDKKRLRKFTS